jgi:hypothetical protein
MAGKLLDEIIKKPSHFQHYFSNIVAVRFIGGGNRSTLRKPLTECSMAGKLLDEIINYIYQYFMIFFSGVEKEAE